MKTFIWNLLVNCIGKSYMFSENVRYRIYKLAGMRTKTKNIRTGCRVNELCNVKLTDIDFETKTLIVFGKGKKYRTVMLNAKSLVSIEEYLKVRKGNSEYLFVSDRYPYEQLHNCGVQKIVRKIYGRTENVNVKLTPHILRHTTATTARKNGMPIENISKMLGHQNINTTLIYAKTDINELRMEHERYVV